MMSDVLMGILVVVHPAEPLPNTHTVTFKPTHTRTIFIRTQIRAGDIHQEMLSQHINVTNTFRQTLPSVHILPDSNSPPVFITGKTGSERVVVCVSV